jgi:hypothetical protein
VSARLDGGVRLHAQDYNQEFKKTASNIAAILEREVINI